MTNRRRGCATNRSAQCAARTRWWLAGVLLLAATTAGASVCITDSILPPSPENGGGPGNAIELLGEHVRASGDSRHASSLSSTEIPPPLESSRPLWWKWTAPASDSYVVDTLRSDFDTVLAVYSGDPAASDEPDFSLPPGEPVGGDALALVGYNDDASGTRVSRVVFEAEAGVTYHIGVGGFDAAVGLIELGISRGVIRVPAEQPSVQAAIDAAGDGETVLVAPGTYEENLVLLGPVVLASEAGPEVTRLAGGDGTTVWLSGGTGGEVVMHGLTVTHRPDTEGNAISLSSLGDVLLAGNVIAGNHAFGAIVSVIGPSAVLSGNTIRGNAVSAAGNIVNVQAAENGLVANNLIVRNTGGHSLRIACVLCDVRVQDNVIDNPDAWTGGSQVLVSAPASAGIEIVQNLIVGHPRSTGYPGGTALAHSGEFVNRVLVNTIVHRGGGMDEPITGHLDGASLFANNVIDSDAAAPALNCDPGGPGLPVDATSGTPWFWHNILHAPSASSATAGCADLAHRLGNRIEDPWFFDPAVGDYRLAAGAPGLERGTLGGDMWDLLPYLDLDGLPRIQRSHQPGNVPGSCGSSDPRLDLGAYEHRPEGVIEFTRASYVAREGAGFANVRVARRGGDSGEVTVSLSSHDLTAAAGIDYGAVDTTLTFLDGEAGEKLITIPLVVDAIAEGPEALRLALHDVTGGAGISRRSKATLVISEEGADLQLLTELSGSAIQFAALDYTITVANNGAIPALEAIVAVNVPAGMLIDDDAGLPAGCEHAGGLVECLLGEIEPGDSITFSLPLLASGWGEQTLTATVSSADDLTPENDLAGTTVDLERAFRIEDYIALLPGTVRTLDSDFEGIWQEAVLRETEVVAGNTTVVLASTDGSRENMIVDQDGAFLQREFFLDPDLGRVTITYSGKGMRYGAGTLRVGDVITSTGSLEYSWTGSPAGSMVGLYQTHSQVLGVEEITVPAGTFETVKVRLSVTLTFDIDDQVLSRTGVSTYWLAEGLGLVRKIVEVEDETETIVLTGTTPGIASPAPGTTLPGASNVTFQLEPNGTVPQRWWLKVGTTLGGDDLHDQQLTGSAGVVTVPVLPFRGEPVHARLGYRIGNAWHYRDYTYTAASVPAPELQAPASGGTLLGGSGTFTWQSHGAPVTGWRLMLGASPGARTYGDTGVLGAGATSHAFPALPYHGETVHARLYYQMLGQWLFVDDELTAAVLDDPALTSHANGATFTGGGAVFTWDDNGVPVEDHAIWFGTSQGGRQYGFAWASEENPSNPAAVSELEFPRLPYQGETVHATFWWKVRGTWFSRPYQFEAASLDLPELTSHANGAAFTSANELFTWDDNGVPAQDHAVWFGATPGGRQYGFAWASQVDPSEPGAVSELRFAALPYRGETVYATFWWRVRGTWFSRPYEFEAVSLPQPTLTSHTDGATLTGASEAFTWDDHGVPAQDHAIWFGSTPGGRQYGFAWASQVDPSNPSAVDMLEFAHLPVTPATVHTTFWWKVRGTWYSRPYTFATPGAALPSLASADVAGGVIGGDAAFTGTSASFTWDDDGLSPQDHAVWLGTVPGGRQHGFAWATQVDSTTPSEVNILEFAGLPADGSDVHVTFWWRVNGIWLSRRYVVMAALP